MRTRAWCVLGLLALAFSSHAAELPADLVEDAQVVLTHDGLKLDAVLTRPRLGFPRAGVVLLHGSGATDMDQTVAGDLTATGLPAKPLRQLAWRLAREGFAVLRYNKRGVELDPRANAPQVLEAASLGDLVADARAAISTLRECGAAPRDRIVLVGHSEGSVIGSLIALDDRGIAGLACLAPLAHNLRDILHYQLVTRVEEWAWQLVDTDHDGRLTQSEIARAPRYHIPLERLDRSQDGVIDHAELHAGLEDAWERFAAAQDAASPWMHEHFGLESNLTRFPRLTVPVQLFCGAVDAQTPLSEARALAEVLGARATLDVFPGLGHGFAPPLALDRPTVGPIADDALDAIARRLAQAYPAPALASESE